MNLLLRSAVFLFGSCVVAMSAMAQLTPSRTSISFGSVRTQATKVETLYVRNATSSAQTLNSVSSNHARFLVSGTTSGTIAAGDSVLVRVTFAPDSIGTASGTLTIASTGPSGSSTATVSLTGTVPVNIRFLSARVAGTGLTSLALADTFATHSRLDSLIIQNDALYIITINSLTTANPEFQVLTSFPFLINSGASVVVRVSYRASAVGRDRDTLRVLHSDPAKNSSPSNLPLTARGLAHLRFTLGGVTLDNFDTVRVSGASAGARGGSLLPPVPIDSARLGQVSLWNRGTADIRVDSIVMKGPNFYSITPGNYTHRIGVAYDRIMQFFYQPKNLSSPVHRDTLIIYTNDTIPGGNRLTLAIEGASTRQVYLRNQTNALTLPFGNVPLGSSSTLIARLYNFRDLALTVDSVRFAARNPRYSVVSVSKTALAQGDTSLLHIRFTANDTLPTLSHTHPDTLLVYAASWSSLPLRLPLSATVTLSIVFSPSATTLNFGSLRTGQTRDTAITVSNYTAHAYRIDSLSFARGRHFFALSDVLTTRLPAGSSTTIELRFQPTTVGTHWDTLLIWHNFPSTLVFTNPRRVALTGTLTTQQLIDPVNYVTVDNATGISGFPISSPDESYVELGPFWQNMVGFGGTHRRSPNLAGSPAGSAARYTFNLDSTGNYLVYHFMVQSGNAGENQFVHIRKFGQAGVFDSLRYNLLRNNSSFFAAGTWLPLTMHHFDGVGPGAASVTIGADALSSSFLRIDAVRLLRSRQKADLEFGRRDINFSPTRVPEEFPQITLGDEFSQPYRLYNLGTDTLVISDIRIIPTRTPVPWFFVKNFTAPLKIPPLRVVGGVESGGYADIQLTFAPFQEGIAIDSMIIISNDANEPEATINLHGEGINYNFLMNASAGGTEPHFRAPAPPTVSTLPRYRETVNGSWLNSVATPFPYPIRGGNASSRVNIGGVATLPHTATYEFELPEVVLGKIATDGFYILEYSGPAGSPNAYTQTKVVVRHSFGVPPDSAHFNARLITSVNHWTQIGGTAKTFFLSPGGTITVDFIRDALTEAIGGAGFLRTDLLRVRKVPTGALIGVDVAFGEVKNFGQVNFRNPAGIDGKANKQEVLIGSRGESQLVISRIRLRSGQYFRLVNPPATPVFLRAITGELRLTIEFLPDRIAPQFRDTLEIVSNSTRDSVLVVPLLGTGVGGTFTVNDDGDQRVEVASVPALGGLYTNRWDPNAINNWQLESSNTPNQIGLGNTRRRLAIPFNNGGRFEWFPLLPTSSESDSIYVQVVATIQPNMTNASPRARYIVYGAGGEIRKDTVVNQNNVPVGQSGVGEINLGNFFFLRGGRDVAGQPSIFGRVRVVNDTALVGQHYRNLNQINVAARDTFALIADAVILRELEAPAGQITNVPGDETIPQQFTLSQNYPNPFNPTTSINFTLPERVRVELKIYDMLGREVATLLHGEEMNPGFYTARWDGRDRFGQTVATGMYIYRIVAGGYVQAKKMVMLK